MTVCTLRLSGKILESLNGHCLLSYNIKKQLDTPAKILQVQKKIKALIHKAIMLVVEA